VRLKLSHELTSLGPLTKSSKTFNGSLRTRLPERTTTCCGSLAVKMFLDGGIAHRQRVYARTVGRERYLFHLRPANIAGCS